MHKGLTFSLVGLAAAGLLTVGVFMIPKNEMANADGGALDKAAVEAVVKEWVENNPDTIIESLNSFQRKQQEEKQQSSRENIKKYADKFGKGKHPFIGAEDASVTVVEFFDYNCGYCKRALPTVNKLTESDKDVKVVFKELPILSPESRTAAQAALAVNVIDSSKYFDIHSRLMEFRGKKTEDNIKKMIEEMGMDWAKVKETMAGAEVTAMLDENQAIARDIGVNGTPSFIVGEQFFPGAVDFNTLKGAVEKQRQGS